MQSTMTTGVVRRFGGPKTIEQMPNPMPNQSQFLMRIVASGVRRTDLHAANGDCHGSGDCRIVLDIGSSLAGLERSPELSGDESQR